MPVQKPRPQKTGDAIEAARLLNMAKSPVILCGGGAIHAATLVRNLADTLDAPVVQTVNARGIIGSHRLSVPASPSLNAVRRLLAQADVVLALGTEFGPTDYDMYETGTFPQFQTLIRVDIDKAQLARRDFGSFNIHSNVESFLSLLLPKLSHQNRAGSLAAKNVRHTAFHELSPAYQSHIRFCETIYEVLPDAIIVGDSTQLVYAGNLFLDAPQPRSWFNSATGFGALGYGPPAAIGASLTCAERPIICLVGDGGFQFSLAELGSANDEKANVVFIVWNNNGYLEIENAMLAAGISPVGVKPSAPDFVKIAQAFGLEAKKIKSLNDLKCLVDVKQRPLLLELNTD